MVAQFYTHIDQVISIPSGLRQKRSGKTKINQCWFDVVSSSQTMAQHLTNIDFNSPWIQNTRPLTNAGLIVRQRRRRWPSIKPTLVS